MFSFEFNLNFADCKLWSEKERGDPLHENCEMLKKIHSGIICSPQCRTWSHCGDFDVTNHIFALWCQHFTLICILDPGVFSMVETLVTPNRERVNVFYPGTWMQLIFKLAQTLVTEG